MIYRRLALIISLLGLYSLGMGHLFSGKIPGIGFIAFSFGFGCNLLAILFLLLSLGTKSSPKP